MDRLDDHLNISGLSRPSNIPNNVDISESVYRKGLDSLKDKLDDLKVRIGKDLDNVDAFLFGSNNRPSLAYAGVGSYFDDVNTLKHTVSVNENFYFADSDEKALKRGVLPDWLKERFRKGNQFNKDNRPKYPYNEVEVRGRKKNYIVDSYVPNEEIVSRKYTQLSEIEEKTAIGYLYELEFKYSPGSIITDSPFNPNVLKGTTLQGDMILEIPVQNKPIPQGIIDVANNKGIIIRDVTGKEYN